METKSHITKQSSGLYEKLIRFYPPSYLSKHREELLQNFEDIQRDIGSSRLFWAFIISDFLKSLSLEYMEYVKRNKWAQFALAAFIVLAAIFVWQSIKLQRAHSTFEHYAAFRGCKLITSRTDTDGTCRLENGQSIKIVQFNGKWYLDGDLPWCIGNFCP